MSVTSYLNKLFRKDAEMENVIVHVSVDIQTETIKLEIKTTDTCDSRADAVRLLESFTKEFKENYLSMIDEAVLRS